MAFSMMILLMKDHPRTGEPGGAWGHKESDTTELLSTGQCINSVNSKHSMNTNSLLAIILTETITMKI